MRRIRWSYWWMILSGGGRLHTEEFTPLYHRPPKELAQKEKGAVPQEGADKRPEDHGFQLEVPELCEYGSEKYRCLAFEEGANEDADVT